MRAPFLQNAAFLADVQEATLAQPRALQLWWLGQSGYLIAWNGVRVVLDPYLSDSLTTKYAATDKPHVRLVERVVAPEHLEHVTLVTASHQHTDHLDAETLVPLLSANPEAILVAPRAHAELAQARLGEALADRLRLLNPGETIQPTPGLRLHAVASAHERCETDSNGNALYLGFLLELGPWRLYHSGDTVRYPGMEAPLLDFRPQLALLPINGRLPERRVAGNLWGEEAAQLAKDIAAGIAIPCHYDMFGFNTASPEAFERACQALGQPYRTLRLGERLTLAHPPD